MTLLDASAAPAPCSFTAFTDTENYQRALRGADVELIVTGSGDFRADVTQVDFDRLWIQRMHESVARVAWAKLTPARSAIVFATGFKQLPMRAVGFEMQLGDIVAFERGKTFHMQTAGEADFGAMSLPSEDLANIGAALIGRDVTLPPSTARVRPSADIMGRLLQLHAATEQLAKSAPEIIAQPEVSRSIEQSLVHIMIRCLTDGVVMEVSDGAQRHAATLVRLEALIEANRDRPLHLAEICVALSVSERTLRTCCHEHLGMGPIQFLWLRRLNLARCALTRASPAETTVTQIATSYGFWELGRFAVSYRMLFGESSSKTLARAPEERSSPAGRPFSIEGPKVQ